MHQLAPQLTAAVAARVTSGDLHDKALRDIGAFVHRTVVEDEHAYAVRIDDGALLDAAEQIEQARAQLSDPGREQAARPARLRAREARDRARRAHRSRQEPGAKLRITAEIRDRARAGASRSCTTRPGLRRRDLGHLPRVHPRPHRRRAQAGRDDTGPAREEAFFAGAGLDDISSTGRRRADRARKQQAKLRHAEASRRNLGLGHDIRAGLIEPTPGQLQALKASSAACSPSTTATSSPTAPAGATRSASSPSATPPHEPRHPDTILDAELQHGSRTPTRSEGSRSSSPAGPPPSPRPRRHHPHQGARLRTHEPQAPRRPPQRQHRSARRRRALVRPRPSPALAAMHRDAFISERNRRYHGQTGRPPRSTSDLDDLYLDAPPSALTPTPQRTPSRPRRGRGGGPPGRRPSLVALVAFEWVHRSGGGMVMPVQQR